MISLVNMINLVKKNILLILLFILTIPTYTSLLRPGYFPMHDDMQAMRLLQMDKCIKDSQIPCRWVPDMGFGYGYPQFNYYSPLPYYIMEFFHLSGLGYLDSVKAGFISSTLVALFGMYLLGSFLWGKAGGFMSSFFYIYAPYRATDFYVRGSVGELWALAFMPFVFLYSIKSLSGYKKDKIIFALSLSALLMSHNISSLIFIPVTFLWVAFRIWQKKHHSPRIIWKKIINFLISFLWGFSISAFFILPAWFERKFVHIETLTAGYFNYINHFLGISQILFDTHWGYGTSEVGGYDDILLIPGLLQWLLPLVALVLLIFLKKKKQFLPVAFITFLGWLALFITHSRSSFVWNNVPFLAILQFPWRFLILATFLFSLALGSLSLLFNKVTVGSKIAFVFLIIVGLMLYKSYFTPRIWIAIEDGEKFSGEFWQRQQTISIFDYLPVYADKPPSKAAPDNPVFLEGEGVINGEKGTDWQKWQILVDSESATIQLPTLYFPGWIVSVDNRSVGIDYENDGLISFSLDKGEHEVNSELRDTPVRRFGNLATLAGIIAIPLYLKRKEE